MTATIEKPSAAALHGPAQERERGGLRRAGQAALLSAVAILGSCTSVELGPTQTIEVISSPVAQADCTLSSDNSVYRVATPGTVDVPNSPRRLVVVCSKPGYQDASVVIESASHGEAMGRFRVSGLSVTEAAGAVVGGGDGYPRRIVVPLRPLQAGPSSRNAPQAGN